MHGRKTALGFYFPSEIKVQEGKKGMTPFDLIELAQRANSVEELISLAAAGKIKLSAEDAQIYFERWHGARELSDDELESVGGGAGELEAQIVCEFCRRGDRLSLDVSAGGGYFCERCNRHCNGVRTKS